MFPSDASVSRKPRFRNKVVGSTVTSFFLKNKCNSSFARVTQYHRVRLVHLRIDKKVNTHVSTRLIDQALERWRDKRSEIMFKRNAWRQSRGNAKLKDCEVVVHG